MYIINVDNQNWLVGDSKGWLATTPLHSMAAIYSTLSDAQEALGYYASSYTNTTFTLCSLSNLEQSQSYLADEDFDNNLKNRLSKVLMQR
jgi:ethanolamine utilization microcompartment shell protein EutL